MSLNPAQSWITPNAPLFEDANAPVNSNFPLGITITDGGFQPYQLVSGTAVFGNPSLQVQNPSSGNLESVSGFEFKSYDTSSGQLAQYGTDYIVFQNSNSSNGVQMVAIDQNNLNSQSNAIMLLGLSTITYGILTPGIKIEALVSTLQSAYPGCVG